VAECDGVGDRDVSDVEAKNKQNTEKNKFEYKGEWVQNLHQAASWLNGEEREREREREKALPVNIN
jgi:hypothetical protein